MPADAPSPERPAFVSPTTEVPVPDAAAVGLAAEMNVAGYLRNAGGAQKHVSHGEGGRGTKRNRVAAVTASDHKTLEQMASGGGIVAVDTSGGGVKTDASGKAEATGEDVKPTVDPAAAAAVLNNAERPSVDVGNADGECGCGTNMFDYAAFQTLKWRPVK